MSLLQGNKLKSLPCQRGLPTLRSLNTASAFLTTTLPQVQPLNRITDMEQSFFGRSGNALETCQDSAQKSPSKSGIRSSCAKTSSNSSPAPSPLMSLCYFDGFVESKSKILVWANPISQKLKIQSKQHRSLCKHLSSLQGFLAWAYINSLLCRKSRPWATVALLWQSTVQWQKRPAGPPT